jgi:hypothetical protein
MAGADEAMLRVGDGSETELDNSGRSSGEFLGKEDAVG